MSSLAPGDLVEVVNTPPPAYYVSPIGRRYLGMQGVIVSTEYDSHIISGLKLHDVRFVEKTTDVATCLLRKISGPPEDSCEWSLTDIPTLTDIVA